MGFLIDSSVIVGFEREGLNADDLRARAGIEPVALAAITASELLHGVHRADTSRRRKRRERFVEGLLGSLPVLPFDLEVARVHAALWVDLARQGQMIGAHDLLIAATALTHELDLATRDRRHFSRVDGLKLETW